MSICVPLRQAKLDEMMEQAPKLLAPALDAIESIDLLNQLARQAARNTHMGIKYQIDMICLRLTAGGFGSAFGRRAATYWYKESGAVATDGDDDAGDIEQAPFLQPAAETFDPEAMSLLRDDSGLGVLVKELMSSGKARCVRGC